MAQLTGLQSALYVDGTLINFVTSLELSVDRDTAEAAVMGSEGKIQRVGAYGASFSGSALVDTASQQIFSEVYAVATTTSNVAIYPDRTDMSDYWYGDAQFGSYSASGAPGDFWAIDFSGIFTGNVYAVGFS